MPMKDGIAYFQKIKILNTEMLLIIIICIINAVIVM